MRKFFAGFATALFFVACASAPIFPYKYYHLTGNGWQGTLLGKAAKDDVPFSKCAPVNGHQQCVVVFYSELSAVIKDYEQTKSDLIACQKGQ